MKTNFYEDEFSEQMILEKSLHEQKLTFNSLINKNTENFHFIFFCLTDFFSEAMHPKSYKINCTLLKSPVFDIQKALLRR